ncbi:hypothetical protein EDD85DRAFT_414181 [Armillaria nabsnona]|nr:hypothetical protein EDD85DRAFT_414181 [Armillaria nabsnona]
MFVAVVSVPLVLSVYDGKPSDAVSSSNSSTKRSVLSSRHYLPGRTTRTQVTYQGHRASKEYPAQLPRPPVPAPSPRLPVCPRRIPNASCLRALRHTHAPTFVTPPFQILCPSCSPMGIPRTRKNTLLLPCPTSPSSSVAGHGTTINSLDPLHADTLQTPAGSVRHPLGHYCH